MAKGTLRVNGVLVASEIHKIVQESGTGSGGGTGVGDEILLETGFHILTEVSATAAIQAQTGDNIVIREDDGSAVLTVDTSGVATFTGNVNVGTDDVGHDVKFHGATAGSYMLWDESTDDLIVRDSNAKIRFSSGVLDSGQMGLEFNHRSDSGTYSTLSKTAIISDPDSNSWGRTSLKFVLDIHEHFSGAPTKDQLRDFCWNRLNSGQVIPGYGHAVLRCPDPRFTAFIDFGKEHIKNDDIFSIVTSLFDVAPEVLREQGKAKNPWPNVDAASGSLLYYYGLKEFNFYTVLFSISRTMGMIAQMVWERALGIPITRPKSVTTDWIKKNS